MQSKPYHFVFKIAIDAYPQKLPFAQDHKLHPGQKTGVLVFIIESKITEKVEEDKTSEVGKEKNKSPPSTVDPGEKSKEEAKKPAKKKRKLSGQEGEERRKKRGKGKPQKESMEELLKILLLQNEDLDKGCVVSHKDFPETASDFFDQISAWFSSVVASKQQQLDQHASKPHMYQ